MKPVLTLSEPRIASLNGLSGVPAGTTRAMLRIVRAAQPISRAELARRLRVNRSTVTEVVKPLLAAGILRERELGEKETGRVGRPPIGLSLCDDGAFFIGVNIGVRRTQVGAATVDGQCLGEESFDTPYSPGATVRRLGSNIERLRAAVPERALLSIGVSVPGPTDGNRTRLLYAPHLKWQDVALADALQIGEKQGAKTMRRLVPVIVENDATAAAVYEARRRLREGTRGVSDDFVLVRAGTGIGVGLVLGGEVCRRSGADGGLVGEFGHMTIVAGGKSCVCGNRGCWELYASAASASSLYAGDRPQAKDGRALRFVEIVARATAGELRARVTLERLGEYLGIGIANVISGLGIGRVVVSGRIVYGWKFINESLREAVAKTMAGRLASWSVEAGEPTGAGFGGALEVAIEQHLAVAAAQARSEG